MDWGTIFHEVMRKWGAVFAAYMAYGLTNVIAKDLRERNPTGNRRKAVYHGALALLGFVFLGFLSAAYLGQSLDRSPYYHDPWFEEEEFVPTLTERLEHFWSGLLNAGPFLALGFYRGYWKPGGTARRS